jgi:hypothetical protein
MSGQCQEIVIAEQVCYLRFVDGKPHHSDELPYQTVANSTREETVWRRESLVFANLSYGPKEPRTGDWTERREEWSLQPDGRLRVEISAESWKSARRVEVHFYRRDGAPR